MEQVPVAIVGAGQAGLATSRELALLGVEHVVLERGRIAQTWRNRWDSFRLVTPNWTVQLPDGHYHGPDPDGFMPRDEIAAFLERYAGSFDAPVREGVAVRTLARRNGGFVVDTSSGAVGADAVVLATGAYQQPYRPPAAATLPADLLQIDVAEYRNEASLPSGRVLVVGSGQSGCQIAEELHEAGRDVVLSCGRAPWLPRRIGGRDLMWWGDVTGFLDAPVESLPDPSARLWANVLATGHGGGRDLHLRTLRARGVSLAGRFLGARDRRAQFAPDLATTVGWGDERYAQLRTLFFTFADEHGLERPSMDDPEPFDDTGPDEIDLAGFGAVVFAGGFRPDYRSWLPWPDAFDEHGFPLHRDGASTVVPGLYFVGVHFLRKRKSSLLIGVGEDAALVARTIGDGLGEPAPEA